jgi:type I restriction enzyme S subunit
MAYKDILRNSKKGAAIPHLNKDIFNNLVIGIPPLAEQHRIVEKLEQLLGEIDKLKK